MRVRRCAIVTVALVACGLLMFVGALSGALCPVNAGLCTNVWRNARLLFVAQPFPRGSEPPEQWWDTELANAERNRTASACSWRAADDAPNVTPFLLLSNAKSGSTWASIVLNTHPVGISLY